MNVSGTGAIVGAGVGAVARAGVMLTWVGFDAPIAIALPSAGIGLLVGAIAGALGKPVRGAIVGAILSGFIFELFMCACVSVARDVASPLLEKGAEARFLTRVLPYTLLMALAGALAGGVGGAIAQAKRAGRQPESPVFKAAQPEPGQPESSVFKDVQPQPEKITEVPPSVPSTEFKELPRFPG